MQEKNSIETNLINIQLYTLFFSLASIIISIIVTYNQKLYSEGKKPLFSPKAARNITLFNRILIFTIAIVFLYVNYLQYKIDKKEENNNVKNDELQIIASILTIGAAIITIYVVSNSETETTSDIENPII